MEDFVFIAEGVPHSGRSATVLGEIWGKARSLLVIDKEAPLLSVTPITFCVRLSYHFFNRSHMVSLITITTPYPIQPTWRLPRFHARRYVPNEMLWIHIHNQATKKNLLLPSKENGMFCACIEVRDDHTLVIELE